MHIANPMVKLTSDSSEYMEAVGPTPTQEDFFARRPSLPHPRTIMAPVNSQPRPHVMEPSVQSIWRPIYPEVIESSQDLLAPKDSPLENVNKTATPEDTTPSYDTPPRETIQPQEIFRGPTKISDSRPQLNNILAAPVSLKELDPKKAEVCPNPVAHPPKVSPQGKATRHTVFTTDAKITEVIKSALVGISITDDGRNMHHDRSNLPNGKSSPGTQSGSDPAASPGSDINSPDSPCSEAFRDLEAQRKAQEVLKTLHDLGYIVQKDPAHTPKPRNPGSAASSKSENLVTCQKCGKFTGRPCELKYVYTNTDGSDLTSHRKHMKRHSRPYGCTFLTCNKTFGSKNDWKRHENSQHYHLETWRCDEEKPEGGACAKVCYRRQTFTDHLKKDHSVTDAEVLKTKVEACRIGRNCQARFWCGFCIKLIDLKNKGLDAWTERFDHIDDHFMGRHDFAKQSIQDWIPIDNSEKPKGDVTLPRDLDSSAGKEGQEELSGSPASSSNASSPESPGVAGESSAHAINLEDRQEVPKRKRSSSSDNMRPAKQPRKAHGEKVVFCVRIRISRFCLHLANPRLVSLPWNEQP